LVIGSVMPVMSVSWNASEPISRLPTWPVMQHSDVQAVERLILHVYPGAGKSWLYEDDGQSMEYQSGEYRVTSFECRPSGENGLTISRQAQGAHCPAYHRWEWHIHGLSGKPEQVLADGQPVQDLSWNDAARILRLDSGERSVLELVYSASPTGSLPVNS